MLYKKKTLCKSTNDKGEMLQKGAIHQKLNFIYKGDNAKKSTSFLSSSEAKKRQYKHTLYRHLKRKIEQRAVNSYKKTYHPRYGENVVVANPLSVLFFIFYCLVFLNYKCRVTEV